MQSIKNILASVALVLTFGLSVSAYATNSGQTFILKGTVSSVDVENNTFTVVHNRAGKTKTYSLPENVKVIFNGEVHYDLSVVKPGQSISMKFRQSGDETAAQEKSPSMEISGTIVDIDRNTMSGVLRQAKTHELVKFRFAENFRKSDIPKKGEKVVFIYRLESLILTST